jgi:uncharacterized protein (DUF697 family)
MMHGENFMEPTIGVTEVKAPAKEETITNGYTVPKAELDKILRYHVWGTMGVGLIPIPIIDLVGITGVQLNLVRVLAQKYHVRFFKDSARNIISSLVGGVLPVAAATPLATSIAKFIPVIGTTVGVVTMPLIAGAATYALGKVFIQHFASGGTFLTFDPEKVKAYYTEMMKEGEKIVAEVKKEKDKEKEKKS